MCRYNAALQRLHWRTKRLPLQFVSSNTALGTRLGIHRGDDVHVQVGLLCGSGRLRPPGPHPTLGHLYGHVLFFCPAACHHLADVLGHLCHHVCLYGHGVPPFPGQQILSYLVQHSCLVVHRFATWPGLARCIHPRLLIFLDRLNPSNACCRLHLSSACPAAQRFLALLASFPSSLDDECSRSAIDKSGHAHVT